MGFQDRGRGDRLTIAHVDAEHGFSGGETQVFLLMEGLRRRGHRNLLFCPPGARCEEEAGARGLEHRTVTMRGDLDVFAALRLRSEFARSDPDLVHLHTGRATWLGGIAARLCEITALTTRRMDRPVRQGWRTRLIYRELVQRAVAISPAVARRLVEGGVAPDTVTTIPSAVEPGRDFDAAEREELRARFEIAPDDFCVLTMASLVKRKGIDVLLQAVATLNGRTYANIVGGEGINAFFDSNDTVTFVMERLDTTTFSADVTKAIVTIPPVPQSRLINIGDGVPPVGYMEFRTFISTAEPRFATVFADFAAAGVTDIIIDMRYNGGGLVRTAELLGDYLGSVANPGAIFSRTEFNADRAPANNSIDLFANPAVANGLNTTRIIVIASGGTASASELVTNSLIPYADVWIVGANTFGKPVGQVGIEFCEKILRPTSFRTANALGDGDYFDGLPVDCPAADDLDIPVGDDSDPNVIAAVSIATTGACPAPAASSQALEVRVEPLIRYPYGRGNTARETAGAF